MSTKEVLCVLSKTNMINVLKSESWECRIVLLSVEVIFWASCRSFSRHKVRCEMAGFYWNCELLNYIFHFVLEFPIRSKRTQCSRLLASNFRTAKPQIETDPPVYRIFRIQSSSGNRWASLSGFDSKLLIQKFAAQQPSFLIDPFLSSRKVAFHFSSRFQGEQKAKPKNRVKRLNY